MWDRAADSGVFSITVLSDVSHDQVEENAPKKFGYFFLKSALTNQRTTHFHNKKNKICFFLKELLVNRLD